MRPAYLLALLILIPSTVTAQDPPKTSGVRYIEEYECRGACVADPKNTDKDLVRFSGYDRSGRMVFLYDLVNPGTGLRWTRHVFTYDGRGNRIGDLEFESAALPEGKYFTIDHTEREPKVVPEVAERETNTTIREYDNRDKCIQERVTDEHHNLIRTWEAGYDNKGRQVNFRQTEKAVVINEIRIVYSADDRSSVTHQSYYSKNSTTSDSFDEKGRTTVSETFHLQPALNGHAAQSPVLAQRSSYTYSGDLTNMDWLICDDHGAPIQRLLIVDKGDDEISRKEFAPKSDGDKLSWVLSSENQVDYAYDPRGELIRYTFRERSSPDQPFKVTLIRLMVITY